MESFLKSPEGKQINVLYAHNDDMALGAIQAIEEAGLKPGVDIRIVSIDGVRAAFEAMVAGTLNCTVECNPLLGPQLFDAVEAIVAKKELPRWIVTKELVFRQSDAAEAIKERKY
jgi:simple sugar transport system substrate-binding protein